MGMVRMGMASMEPQIGDEERIAIEEVKMAS